MAKYEARLWALMRAHVFPQWRTGTFEGHRRGQVKRVPKDVALEDAKHLLASLERDESVLQYEYGVRRVSGDGVPRERNASEIKCLVGGKQAVAVGGPGRCWVEENRWLDLDGPMLDSLQGRGLMRASEAEMFREVSTGLVMTEMLHDLRDMKPFVTDHGDTLLAVRKPHPTAFVDAVRGLLAFMQREQGEFVDLVYRGP